MGSLASDRKLSRPADDKGQLYLLSPVVLR